MATFNRSDAADRIVRIRVELGAAFDWASTPEGYEYWTAVSVALLRLHGEAIIQGHNKRSSSPVGSVVLPANLTHIFDKGDVLCKFSKGKPNEWPKGHERVTITEADKATCTLCRAVFLGPKK